MPQALFTTFQEQFSLARMEPYEVAAGEDPELTVRLYDWNIQISAAFFEDLGVVEILLRNALDRALREEYQLDLGSKPWYEQNILLRPQYLVVDEEIKNASDGSGVPPNHDSVIAALPFGFWRHLLGPGYQISLWPKLEKAFPYSQPGATIRRSDIYERVADLHELRNHIAHHEPIFAWEFQRSLRNLKMVAGAICPEAQIWMVQRSRVPAVLDNDPRQPRVSK
jgi:hypothetical protein